MKISATIFLIVLLLAAAASEAAGRDWETLCKDRDRAAHYPECWRPPGDYQAVWQMQGEKRTYYLKQAKKVVAQRQRTESDLAKWRYRRGR